MVLGVIFFAPKSKLSKYYQSPVNKFISSTASYLVFLLIIFLQSNMDKSEQLRGPPNTGIQTISWCTAMSKKIEPLPLRPLTSGCFFSIRLPSDNLRHLVYLGGNTSLHNTWSEEVLYDTLVLVSQELCLLRTEIFLFELTFNSEKCSSIGNRFYRLIFLITTVFCIPHFHLKEWK